MRHVRSSYARYVYVANMSEWQWVARLIKEWIYTSKGRVTTHIFLNTPPRVYKSINWTLFVDRHMMRNTWCVTCYIMLYHGIARNSGAYLSLIPSFSLFSRKPNSSTKRQHFGLAKGLVKISAGLSSVGTYTTDIFPSSTASWTKWYHTSICFVRAWNLLFLTVRYPLDYRSWSLSLRPVLHRFRWWMCAATMPLLWHGPALYIQPWLFTGQ